MKNEQWKMKNKRARGKVTRHGLNSLFRKLLLRENVSAVLWTTRTFTMTSNGQCLAIT